ncbi:MAG TPA: hypothetical protein VFE58_15555 [Tepidisphaeraceae bacterium]|nr:hypothetical protein [Tepidisphaeraceae bacterium]
MRKWIFVILVAAAGGGCASQLDSGYEPRRLSASDAQRRSYYASPYSEETQQSLHDDRFADDKHPTKY